VCYYYYYMHWGRSGRLKRTFLLAEKGAGKTFSYPPVQTHLYIDANLRSELNTDAARVDRFVTFHDTKVLRYAIHGTLKLRTVHLSDNTMIFESKVSVKNIFP
jgi:hypothetical protein